MQLQTFNNVFDAISDTPNQAANLKMRSEIMQHIQSTIKDIHGTQAAIAKQCGITQPRLNDLLQGKISKFSLDALVNISANLDMQVHVAFA
ncbi:MAG: XRE family transcriptional regulator [Moraxella sp.]|nr:XRE family transcriptional regulator [Moraxella sp.]